MSEVPLYQRVDNDPLPQRDRLYAMGTTTLRVGSNCLFQGLDLYWRSLESGGVWYKSRRLKMMS